MRTVIGMLIATIATNAIWYWAIYGIPVDPDPSPKIIIGVVAIMGTVGAFVVFVAEAICCWNYGIDWGENGTKN